MKTKFQLKKVIASTAFAGLLMLTTQVWAQQSGQLGLIDPNLLNNKFPVSPADAALLAVNQLGGKPLKVKLTDDKTYEVTVRNGEKILTIIIDATTGEILG